MVSSTGQKPRTVQAKETATFTRTTHNYSSIKVKGINFVNFPVGSYVFYPQELEINFLSGMYEEAILKNKLRNYAPKNYTYTII